MLSLDPDVNDEGRANGPPVTWAVCVDGIHYLKALLDHGADTSVRDPQGKTASDYARQFGKDDFLSLLARHRGQRDDSDEHGSASRSP